MLTPPTTPPTSTPTLSEGRGADDEADVGLRLSTIGVVVESSRIFEKDEAVGEDEALGGDEAVKELVDEEKYADEVSDREEERKPIGSSFTASPLTK